jgi:predicted HAD superfamily Cof-like phosphohydrolase
MHQPIRAYFVEAGVADHLIDASLVTYASLIYWGQDPDLARETVVLRAKLIAAYQHDHRPMAMKEPSK